ncbi:hypothetical protein NKR19_g8733 [Coniochaeta hoffmannii]|uniref:Uncharacterized protein n=1 Tax=Coniochaeta hoffmannii TaxID=91930 RepID=A0AA38VIV0_9PEZI|nr:hypothetical protein NKR19_g8733 [Coniochaeta hoffmannii]
MNITEDWPPSYFDPKDLVVLANQEVMTVLGGVNANNRALRQQYAIVNSRNMPLLIRIQLCHLALTQYSADKDWALFLSPIGFLDDSHRRNWYTVAGQQTKVFTTTKHFLSYAYNALMHRNKTFNVGMFAHWLLQSRDVQKVADFVHNDPAELWTDREMMHRYATVVIIRRIPTGVLGQHAVTEYRRLVAEAMKEWADENGILIEKRYYGRPVSRDNAVAGGGVRQCFAYLESLISGQNLGHTMPDAEDQAAFERLGYMPLNRTLNRGGRRQGWETTGLGPRTRSLETPLCLLCP